MKYKPIFLLLDLTDIRLLCQVSVKFLSANFQFLYFNWQQTVIRPPTVSRPALSNIDLEDYIYADR